MKVAAINCVFSPGLSTTYKASAGAPTKASYTTRAEQYVSNALEAALEKGVQDGNAQGIVNPYSGKKSILNLSNANLSAANSNPAVLITKASGCRYAGFQKQSTAIRDKLKGSVIACWNTVASVNSIEIYYVDGNGAKSDTARLVSLDP